VRYLRHVESEPGAAGKPGKLISPSLFALISTFFDFKTLSLSPCFLQSRSLPSHAVQL
jgi:hypothetical protein